MASLARPTSLSAPRLQIRSGDRRAHSQSIDQGQGSAEEGMAEAFDMYRKSVISTALLEILNEMVGCGKLGLDLAINFLLQFEKSMSHALDKHVTSRATFKTRRQSTHVQVLRHRVDSQPKKHNVHERGDRSRPPPQGQGPAEEGMAEVLDMYRQSVIDTALLEMLNEMVGCGKLSLDLAINVLLRFDKSMSHGLDKHVTSRSTFKMMAFIPVLTRALGRRGWKKQGMHDLVMHACSHIPASAPREM